MLEKGQILQPFQLFDSSLWTQHRELEIKGCCNSLDSNINLVSER